MDVSAYSLVALAREALPLFHTAGGGSITSMSYIGARSVRASPCTTPTHPHRAQA